MSENYHQTGLPLQNSLTPVYKQEQQTDCTTSPDRPAQQHTAPKIIVAMDTFKGCLSARQACQAVATGIKEVLPEAKIVMLPVSDGGEGLLDACAPLKQISIQAENPARERITANYGIDPKEHAAVIETARIIGLPLLDKSQRNPWLTSTYGVGEMITDALERGYRNFLIGLGGSATTDAGLGMLQALGYVFYDTQGEEMNERMCGQSLMRVANIDRSHVHPLLGQAHFTIICDVTNPLYGEQGAAYVFAPQKGADQPMVEKLDKGLRHIGELMRHITGRHVASIPGAGAAGGLGAAFMTFMEATFQSGISYVLKRVHFQQHLANADLIITGEGHSDRQTLMGKVPQGVMQLALQQNIPTVLLSGAVTDVDRLNEKGFCGVFSIAQGPESLTNAMQADTAISHLRITAKQVCRTFYH